MAITTTIYDRLEALLSAGTWSNYHGTTPHIWEFNLKKMKDMKAWAKHQKEGVVIQKRPAGAVNVADGRLFGENQKASILAFSTTDRGILEDLHADLADILGGEGYVFLTKERHDEPRLHWVILRVRKLVTVS